MDLLASSIESQHLVAVDIQDLLELGDLAAYARRQDVHLGRERGRAGHPLADAQELDGAQDLEPISSDPSPCGQYGRAPESRGLEIHPRRYRWRHGHGRQRKLVVA